MIVINPKFFRLHIFINFYNKITKKKSNTCSCNMCTIGTPHLNLKKKCLPNDIVHVYSVIFFFKFRWGVPMMCKVYVVSKRYM